MAIELATQFQAYTDEQFYSESKTSLVTNKDFSFDGAKTIKLYKMQSTEMEDFNRNGPILDGNKSQYGTISTLQATTETFTINKDRSFTFEVDKMDTDETKMQVAAASALARQQREKVFPEIDSYVYSVMAANAGIKPEAAALTAESIYTQIITANAQMDDAEVPASDRVLILTPTTYTLLKQSKATFDNSDIGAELRKRGVIAQLDGLNVVKIASNRLPAKFGFMIAHPVATVARSNWQSTRFTLTRLSCPAVWWKAEFTTTRSFWKTKQRASIIRLLSDMASSGRMGLTCAPFLYRGEYL
jgi:hypothetical protein